MQQAVAVVHGGCHAIGTTWAGAKVWGGAGGQSRPFSSAAQRVCRAPPTTSAHTSLLHICPVILCRSRGGGFPPGQGTLLSRRSAAGPSIAAHSTQQPLQRPGRCGQSIHPHPPSLGPLPNQAPKPGQLWNAAAALLYIHTTLCAYPTYASADDPPAD